MALQQTITQLKDLLDNITQDISKAENGNKAASQRVRTMTVRLEKIAKSYRKESIASEKQNRNKKGSRKGPASTKAKKPTVPTAKVKTKQKPKASLAKPRALALKKPTAKLPIRSFR